MKTIIHDLENLDFLSLDDNYKIIDNKDIKDCQGCFNCWVKTPLKCILNDKISENGKTLLESDELIIISKCINGCYSSKVKRILERSISFVEPYFTLRDKEVHHSVRTSKKIKFKVFFYGDINDLNREVAIKLVDANRKNLNTSKPIVNFVNDYKEIKI